MEGCPVMGEVVGSKSDLCFRSEQGTRYPLPPYLHKRSGHRAVAYIKKGKVILLQCNGSHTPIRDWDWVK